MKFVKSSVSSCGNGQSVSETTNLVCLWKLSAHCRCGGWLNFTLQSQGSWQEIIHKGGCKSVQTLPKCSMFNSLPKFEIWQLCLIQFPYENCSSADNRNRNWSGGGGGSIGSNIGKGLGLLGEALCHAQTRAREAEKQADQTLQEYKKLLKLFFQEASFSLTYCHWVTFLQTENTWLKMYLNHQQAAVWLQRSFFSSFAALECL
jgi:hypothetical protein